MMSLREVLKQAMEDNSEFEDPLTWFHEAYKRLYMQTFRREMLGLDENDQPRYRGPRGLINAIFDEVHEWEFWSNRPETFTPKEFQRMWDSYDKNQKINYVRILIT